MGNINGAKVSPESLPKEKTKITKMWENFIKHFLKEKSGKCSIEEPEKPNHDEVEIKDQEFAFPENCEYTQADILHQLREEGIIGAKNVTNRAGGVSFFLTSDVNMRQPHPRFLAKLEFKSSRTQSAPTTDFSMEDKMLVADILRQECITKKIKKAQNCGKKRKKNLEKREKEDAAKAGELKEMIEMKMIVADANRHDEIYKKRVATTKFRFSVSNGKEFKKEKLIEEMELQMIVADATRQEQEVKKKAKARKAVLRTAPIEKMEYSESS